MRLPRDISGVRLAELLCRRWQYKKVNQVGSQIILETSELSHHRIPIPNHNPLRLRTLHSVLRSA